MMNLCRCLMRLRKHNIFVMQISENKKEIYEIKWGNVPVIVFCMTLLGALCGIFFHFARKVRE